MAFRNRVYIAVWFESWRAVKHMGRLPAVSCYICCRIGQGKEVFSLILEWFEIFFYSEPQDFGHDSFYESVFRL
jgi:hypothetical protein